MTPSQTSEQDKARRQVMTGVVLIMGACIFGGLTAVVLAALGQRTVAMGVAVVAGIAIIAGFAVQMSALRKLKAASKPGSK